MRSRAIPPLALLLILGALAAPEAQSLRKIGEMELSLVGLSATVDGARPAIPKNVASGVKILIRAGGTPVAPGAVARLLGPFSVEGEVSGPSFGETVTVRQSVDASNPATDLILPLPVMAISGEHTLANLRIVGDGRPLFDLQPRSVPIDVIEQVLITSVRTRPLTLQEIRDKGIVLDSDDYLGFEFTLGLLLESKAVNVAFPVVFDREGIALPVPQSVPSLRVDGIADPISPPRILPMMLTIPKLGPGLGLGLEFDDEDIRIPSVLVIPGEVGYLRQFFSAQLFVGNGTPATANLTVRDVTGTLILPPGADLVAGSADDPLSLAETVNGVQPLTMAIAAVGPDGLPATADDVTSLRAGEQGQAEFLVRGDLEGYHSIAFDIEGELDGLATGPITVTGRATGGVLVRNPFFDVSFVVPTVVRRNEPFTLYATVSNKGQGVANDVSMTLDAAALSGVRLLGEASLSIETLKPGDAKTLAFEFEALRTGQVVASYLRFTGPGATGNLAFKVGVGERGVVLSPDTLVLPAQVDELPPALIDTAMRVLGQAWSIANAPPNTLPAGVTRIAKTVVTAKALALAEAGLRITLGQPEADAIRDLIPDFHGPAPVDRGFDQLLRTTDAGRNFDAAVGAALAGEAAAGPAVFEGAFSQVAASGRDFIAFSIGNGSAGAGVDVTLRDASGGAAAFTGTPDAQAGAVVSAAMVPLGPAASAPLFGYLAAPTAGPYTLELTGRASSQVDLSVTYPRGDGQFTRVVAAGALVAPGATARFAIDPSRAPPVLEIDTDGDGSVDVSMPLAVETITATAPQFVSATIVGPETFPSAGPYGLNLAMLFDRVVDASAAAQVSRYSIPDNRVVSARSQLSGRLVFAGLALPEGPYVPSSVSVSGMSDLRGVVGGTEVRTLQSRLADPGAVVSGRVISSDGGSAAGIRVIYHNNVDLTCETPIFPGSDALAAAITDEGGRYQFRYVWRDHCGKAWRMRALDEVRRAERSVSGVVRSPGERVQADIALLGRGAVTGIVRNLSGLPVANAQVIAVSTIEQQVGGSATTDGDGRYTIFDLTVGPVTVKAASGLSVGTASGQIARAGTTATADVTLNSGSVTVAGVVRKLEGGVTSLAGGATVIFEGPDPLSGQSRIAGVTTTDADGDYALTAMPSGPYTLKAVLGNGDSGTVTGTTSAGDTLLGRDVLVAVLSNATVSGIVRYPDGAPAANPIVLAASGGTQGAADGTFTIENFKFLPAPQKLTAYSGDGLREGQATVLVNQSGQVLNGVVITLGGLGTLELTVIDSAGQLVRNQIVTITRVGSNRSPNNCTGFYLVPTNDQGIARFENLAVGPIHANALRAGAFGVDVADFDGVIPHEGATVSGVMRFGGGGTVTGVVLDDRGQPVFGADIEISSKVYQNGTCELWPGVSHRLRTDLTGRYRATGVPVGSVRVQATQAFFPTPIGASGVIARNGDELVLNMQVVNTIAGELSGTVFLPDGVTPAGAGVTVTAIGHLPEVVVSTDAAGTFRFPEIFPAGTLQVTARDPQSGGVVRDHVVVRVGVDTTHNFRLKGRGTVRVNVVDGAGVAVPSALVTLKEGDYPSETFEGVIDASTEGAVTFEGVHEGRFSLSASDVFGRGGRASGELPADGTSVDVTIRLTVTGTVTGHFYLPDGVTPIPFATVKLLANGKVIGQASSSSGSDSGAFEFAYVPAGTIRLEALDPATGRSGVAVGQLTIDGQLLVLDVRAQGLGVVRGRITSQGAGDLEPVAQPGARATVSSGSFRATATADAAGIYSVPGVPEGAVSVTADLQGALQGVATASLLGDGTELTLDVALKASGAVVGTVTGADGVTPAPPSIVSIVVGGPGGGRYTAPTNELGAYRFDLVPAGGATLSVDVIGSIDTATAWINVVGAQTNTVPVQLVGLGSITGTAEDANGNPVGGTVTITGSGAVPYTVTLSVGPDGGFHAAQVLAGPYSAKLRSTINGFTLYGTAGDTVTPGATSNVMVSLQSTGEIRGAVHRADGASPAIGAEVSVKSGTSTVASTQVLSDGSFAVTGVPLGTYSVSAYDIVSNGYARALNLVLAANGDVADAGTLVLDDAAVAVVSVTPTDGATGISRTTPIVVTFTDALANTSGVNIKAGTSTVSASRTLSDEARTLTLTGTWPDSSEITVEVTAGVTDLFGRHPIAPLTIHFRTVDTTAPSVTSVSPLAGAIQVAGATAINVTFSEPFTNATADGLIQLTGPAGPVAGVALITSPTTISFTPSEALPANAIYTVSVDGATDASGNEQGAVFAASFATVDTVAPVLSVTSPSLATWVTDATPFIRVAVSDAVSGIQSASATLTLDGTAVSPSKSASQITFTAPALADGTHTISATVADQAGNTGALATASFMLDATAPTGAALTNVTAGQVISGSTPIAATATDATSGVARIYLRRNGSTVLTLLPPFTGSWNASSTSDGVYSLTVAAEDVAGNTGSDSAPISVVVNNEELAVAIGAPAPNFRTRRPVTVTATVNEPVQRVDFTLGAITISDTTSPYSAELDVAALPEGNATITVLAVGLLDETATAIRTIVVDRSSAVARWPFDEGAGLTTADASGNGHTGTLVGGAAWSAIGRFGKSIEFGGVDGAVTAADGNDFDMTSALTLSAWVSPTTLGGVQTVIAKGGAASPYSLAIGADGRVQAVVETGGAPVVVSSVSPVPLAAWTHVAATYDANSLRLYVNGVEAGSASGSGTLAVNDGAIWIGRSEAGDALTGRLDEVRIYDRVLSAAEVESLSASAADGSRFAAGYRAGFVAQPGAQAWAMGQSSSGDLGTATNGTFYVPEPVVGLIDVVDLAAGDGHGIALTGAGIVYTWGDNIYGALGNGTTSDRSTPTALGLDSVVAIASGRFHSLALKANGDAYTWGQNSSGQLGDGTTTNSLVPRLVMTGVRAIGAGSSFSLFVKADGTVWSVGANGSGQLGDGTKVQRLLPVPMIGITGAVAAAGGDSHSIVLLSDGSLRAVGSGTQIGNGSSTDRTVAVAVAGMTNVTALAPGIHHTLVLRADGTVWAWGTNSSGQLGDGTNTTRTTPVQALLVPVVEIGSGWDQSYAVTADGQVFAWGDNGYGVLGDGSGVGRSTPTPISAENYEWKVATPTFSVASGVHTTSQPLNVDVAVGTPGAVIHYTRNGVEPTEADPVVAGGSVVVDVSQTVMARAFKAGMPPSNVETRSYTLQVPAPGISTPGGVKTTPQTISLTTIAGAEIRYTTDGSNPTATSPLYEQPFIVSTTSTVTARAYKPGWQGSLPTTRTYTMNFGTLAPPVISPGTGTYVGSVTVTLSSPQPGATIHFTEAGGTLNTSDPEYLEPRTLTATTTIRAKAFHSDYTESAESSAVFTLQALTPTLSLPSGTYAPGTLITITGDTTTTIRYSIDGTDPTAAHPAVASGGTVVVGGFTLKARAFKDGNLDSAVAAATYTASGDLTAAAMIGGDHHSFALTRDGRAYAWGYNFYGQFGDGTTASHSNPMLVHDLTGIVSMSASNYHSMAVTSDGRLLGWGRNVDGVIGDGTTTNRHRPVPVPSLSGVVAGSTGAMHSAALLANGDAYTWGDNDYGQLGDGTNTRSLVPKLVMSGVRSVVAGYQHTLFIKLDGSVWGAGLNNNGQLGDGTLTSRSTPVPMNGVTGARAVAGGYGFSLILLDDGTLKAVGAANMVGDGSTVRRTTAVAVAALNEVVEIKTGLYHSLALKSDGTVWAWGQNSTGRLGNPAAQSPNQLTPLQVPGLSDVAAIGAGHDYSFAVTADDVAFGWGDGSWGAVGDGVLGSRLLPKPLSIENYVWQVATPTLVQASGTYQNNVSVTVTVPTPGATIHYTRDGVEPTEADPTVASGGTVLIDVSQTLTVKAWAPGMPPSNPDSATYTLQVATPTASPTASTHTAPVTVTLASATPGATLYYATGPTAADTPTPTTASTLYAGPFTIATTSTVKVIGVKAGWTDSAVGSRTYTMNFGTLAAPTIAPGTGTYSGSVTVTLAAPQPGATIRYTITGGTVGTSSPIYTAPLTVTTTTTVKAKAFHPDYTTSLEASALLTFDTTAPTIPTIAPASGASQVAVSAVISATFNEAIQDPTAATIFTVTSSAGPVAGAVARTNATTLTFTPLAPLAPDTQYSVVVDDGVDLSGNVQTTPRTWSFKTVDTIAPVLTFEGTAFSTKRPQLDVYAWEFFSSVVAPATLALDGVNLSTTLASLGSGQWRLRATPTFDLAEGSHTLTASVADSAGNLATMSWDFTVQTVLTNILVTYRTADGSPVEGADVMFVRDGINSSGGTTDAAGQRLITNKAAGPFTLEVTDPDSYRARALGDGVITLADAGTTIAVDVTQAPMGSVLVRALAADGVTPVPYWSVHNPVHNEGSSNTDEEGRVQFDNLSRTDGVVQIRLRPPAGFASDILAYATITTEGEVVDLPVILPVGVIRGVVAFSDGAPVPDVSIMATQQYADYLETFYARVDGAGGYVIVGPVAGDVTITAQDSETSLEQSATVAVVDVATPVTANLVLPSTGTVTGVVRSSAGQPMPDIWVTVTSGAISRYTVTDASGAYVLGYVLPGAITVQTASDPALQGMATATLTAGEVVTIDVTLAAIGTLTGTVLDAAGQPASGVSVQIVHGTYGSFWTYTDWTGVYPPIQLPIGSVTVIAGFGGTGVDASVSGSLSDGEAATIDVTLPPFGTVTGTVFNESGNPQYYADVRLQAASGPQRSVTANVSGVYTVNYVPLGAVTLAANYSVYGAGATTVASHGVTATADLALEAAQLTVTVKDSDGVTNATSSTVSTQTATGGLFGTAFRSGTTSSGVFVMTRHATGVVTVTASKAGKTNTATITVVNGVPAAVTIILPP